MVESDAAARLSALSHPSRLRLFRMLIQAGPQGVPAGALAQRLDIAPSNLSAHLNVLSHTGLVGVRRVGRSRIYWADTFVIGALIEFLVSDCCNGNPEVCGLVRQALGARC